MKIKLDDVMKSYRIKELSPNADEFIIEFEFTVDRYVVTFQSLPMPKEKAYSVGQAILTWANEYSLIRKKVSLLFSALHSVKDVIDSTTTELTRRGY